MRELAIKEAEGLYYAYTPLGEEVAASLESLLTKLVPNVPPATSLAWAEVTDTLLGPAEHSRVVTGLADTSDR